MPIKMIAKHTQPANTLLWGQSVKGKECRLAMCISDPAGTTMEGRGQRTSQAHAYQFEYQHVWEGGREGKRIEKGKEEKKKEGGREMENVLKMPLDLQPHCAKTRIAHHCASHLQVHQPFP